MAANLFKIDGEKVQSQKEFLAKESDTGWNNILYMPDLLASDSRKPLMFNDKRFYQVSFKDTDIQNARFIDCVFEQCLFIGASLEDCEFTDCKFISTNTSKVQIRRCLLAPSNFKDNFDLKTDTNIAIGTFHSLYKNATEEHQPEHAIESLFQMREAEYKHLDSQLERNRITRRQYYSKKVPSWFFRVISGYGLRFRRILYFAFLMLLLFTTINYVWRDAIFSSGEYSALDVFYFTAVTISTLGYGDITPTTDIGKLLVVLQALTGFGVLSIVLAGVTNKALRGR